MRGGLDAVWLKDKGFQTEEVLSIEQNLKKLMLGRVDMVATAKHNFLYLLETEYPAQRQEVTIVGQRLFTKKVYNTIRRNHPHAQSLITSLNEGLSSLEQETFFEDLLPASATYQRTRPEFDLNQ